MSGALFQQITDLMPTLDGWCTPEKAQELAGLVIEHKPKVCYELGLFGGRSFLAIGLALKDTGCGTITGVDAWSNAAALEGEKDAENIKWWSKIDLDEIYRKFVNAVVAAGALKECRWLRMPSEVAAKMVAKGTIDFLHQDNNHSELVSCRDVKLWAPKMAKRSIWILDDADWPSQNRAIALIKDAGFKVIADRKTYLVFRR